MPAWGGGAGQSWNIQGRMMYVPPLANPGLSISGFGPQGYRGISSLGGGEGPLRLGGSIGGNPATGGLLSPFRAQAEQQAAAEQERQRQASAAAAEAERQRQAAAAAEAERLRIRGLEQAGAFTKAAWRYAGSLAIPAAAARATPIGSRFQQSLVIPTGSPAGSAASAVGSRRQLMIERRQQLASTTADPMGSNYNRAFAIPGTGG